MKSIMSISVFALSVFFAGSAISAELVNSGEGKEKMGSVSVIGAYSLDALTKELGQKADKAGAGSYRIVAAGGKNRMQGVAEIYK